MEKDLFVSTLKEKTGVDNLSERTIDEVAALFLPMFAEDEKITDDTWKLPVQMVKTMSGQLRHDLSGGINDFKTQFEAQNKTAQEQAIANAVAAAKEEWEKNHPNNNPPKNEPPKNEPDVDQKIADAIAKAMSGMTGEDGAIGKLTKQFSDYLTQQAEKEKQQTISNVRSQIKDYFIELGIEENDYALEIALEKLEIGDKPDLSALKSKAKKDYETIYKRMYGDGANPLNGGGGGGGNDSNADFTKFINERNEQAKKEAKDAEELKKFMM